MSDALLQSAFIYQEISKYEYYFIFGDKKRNLYYIPIKLKNENYPHLIGIDKLTDKKELIFKKGKDKIIERIINNEITFQNIEDLNNYDLSKYKNILVTAGASTPSAIINEVLDILQTKFDKKPYKSLLKLEDYLKF